MQYICYSKCSTCNRGEKWLIQHQFIFEKRDIKSNPLTLKELDALIKINKLNPDKLFNTSGLQYIAKKLKEQMPLLSYDDKLKLLASECILIKRPLIIDDNQHIYIGFKESEWQNLK